MIEVGEYVRTKTGNIGKIENIEYVNIDIDWIECDSYGCSCIPEHIKKHSKNIIDLIEVGDYVNGHRICRIDNNITIWLETENQLYCGIYEKDIKTILTKELFEANCYKVKEE